jgi:hypothetical protein
MAMALLMRRCLWQWRCLCGVAYGNGAACGVPLMALAVLAALLMAMALLMGRCLWQWRCLWAAAYGNGAAYGALLVAIALLNGAAYGALLIGNGTHPLMAMAMTRLWTEPLCIEPLMYSARLCTDPV